MLDKKNPAISIIEFNVNEWIKQPSQETEIVRVDKKNKLQVQAVPGGSDGSLPAMHETQVRSLGREDPLEESMVDKIVHGVAESQTQLSD